MARLARIVMPGDAHQVTQRDSERQYVFFSDADRRAYFDMLRESAWREGLSVSKDMNTQGTKTTLLSACFPNIQMKNVVIQDLIPCEALDGCIQPGCVELVAAPAMSMKFVI